MRIVLAHHLLCHLDVPLGANADMLFCIEVESAASEENQLVYAQFLDGAAEVQLLNPGTAKTFLEYAVHVFCHNYVSEKLHSH